MKSEAGKIQFSGAGIAALAGVLVLGVSMVSVFTYVRSKNASHERKTDEGKLVSAVPSQDRALPSLPPLAAYGNDKQSPLVAPLNALPEPSLPEIPKTPTTISAPIRTEHNGTLASHNKPEPGAPGIVPAGPSTVALLGENCTVKVLAGDDAMQPTMTLDDLRLSEITAQVSCKHAVKDAVLEWLVGGSQTDVRGVNIPQGGQVQSVYGNKRPAPGLYVVRLRVGPDKVESSFTVAAYTHATAKDQ
jgi:hypothetical protein